jgi:hypothetical protein
VKLSDVGEGLEVVENEEEAFLEKCLWRLEDLRKCRRVLGDLENGE